MRGGTALPLISNTLPQVAHPLGHIIGRPSQGVAHTLDDLSDKVARLRRRASVGDAPSRCRRGTVLFLRPLGSIAAAYLHLCATGGAAVGATGPVRGTRARRPHSRRGFLLPRVETTTMSEYVFFAELGLGEKCVSDVGAVPVKQHEVLRVVKVVGAVPVNLGAFALVVAAVQGRFLRRRLVQSVGGSAGGGARCEVDPLPRVGVVHRRDTDAHPRLVAPVEVLLEEGVPAALDPFKRLPPRGGGLVAGGPEFFDPLVPPGAAQAAEHNGEQGVGATNAVSHAGIGLRVAVRRASAAPLAAAVPGHVLHRRESMT